jgi:hypothetical protein
LDPRNDPDPIPGRGLSRTETVGKTAQAHGEH